MTKILTSILVALILTLFFSIKSRFNGSSYYKKFSFLVVILTIGFFLLLLVVTNIGGESTPIWITTTNLLNKECKVYYITVYNHPVSNEINRFVYKGTTLKPNKNSTTIIEYDGAMEFWTIATDKNENVIFFNASKLSSIEKYDISIVNNTLIDVSKAQIAINEIIRFEKQELTKNVLITIDLLLLMLLIIDLWNRKSIPNSKLDDK